MYWSRDKEHHGHRLVINKISVFFPVRKVPLCSSHKVTKSFSLTLGVEDSVSVSISVLDCGINLRTSIELGSDGATQSVGDVHRVGRASERDAIGTLLMEDLNTLDRCSVGPKNELVSLVNNMGTSTLIEAIRDNTPPCLFTNQT